MNDVIYFLRSLEDDEQSRFGDLCMARHFFE